MGILIAILLALFPGQGPQAPPIPPNPADFATVEGTAIWASQSRPLEGIPVYLRRDGEPVQESQRRGVAVTDNSGQFILRNVPPGDYAVVPNRQGYFPETGPPVRITVTPKAAMRGIILRMIVGGTIAGRIQDSNGVGLTELSVIAAQAVYLQTGERSLLGGRGGSATTDDRGEYRVRGVLPGTYYIAADSNVWASDTPTYYPGTKDEVGAVPLIVREAQESTANFRVDVKLRPVFAVSGVVTSAVPGVPAKIVERILISSRGSGSTYYDNRADDRSNGRFEIRNIFPDAYELFPEARDAEGRLYTSRTPVDIVDRDIENLTLPAVPVVDIFGRILLNGERLANRLPNMNVNLQTVKGLNVGLTRGFGGPQTPNPLDRDTGEFTIAAVPPGVYKITANPVLPDVYVEDMRRNNVSVYTDGFTVTDKSGDPVELLLASPGGRINGVVTDVRQQPFLNATVVLVPDPSRRQDATRYKTASSDRSGRFTFQGIAPGLYKIFAWDAPLQNAWRNAEFMLKHEARGRSVTIDRGSIIEMPVDVIPKDPN